MLKLAMPISDLFNDAAVRKAIISGSYCLECRERTSESAEPRQYLFHFEKDILRPWLKSDKNAIKSVISSKDELKLITFHMEACCSKPVLKNSVFFSGGRRFRAGELIDNARKNIKWLKACLPKKDIEIAVENNNYYPTPAYKYITEPEFIARIVHENGIKFLFDLAHAKISSYNKKMPYRKYLDALPMERIVQIHVSKSGVNKQGLAYDAHGIPDRSILREVKEIISKFSPLYLTIEYYADGKRLITAMEKFRKICG